MPLSLGPGMWGSVSSGSPRPLRGHGIALHTRGVARPETRELGALTAVAQLPARRCWGALLAVPLLLGPLRARTERREL